MWTDTTPSPPDAIAYPSAIAVTGTSLEPEDVLEALVASDGVVQRQFGGSRVAEHVPHPGRVQDLL
jgi:hypothetical protein